MRISVDHRDDLEAERIIVGTIASFQPGFSHAVESLDPTDFADRLCRAVFRVGKSVCDRWGDVPDIETVIWKLDDLGVLEELGGEKAVYDLLNDFGNNALVDWAIEVVRQASEARRIAEAARQRGRVPAMGTSHPVPQRGRRKTARDALMRI